MFIICSTSNASSSLKDLGITLDVKNDNIEKMEFLEENTEKIVDYLYKFISDGLLNDKSDNYFTTDYPECYDKCSNLESKNFYVKWCEDNKNLVAV